MELHELAIIIISVITLTILVHANCSRYIVHASCVKRKGWTMWHAAKRWVRCGWNHHQLFREHHRLDSMDHSGLLLGSRWRCQCGSFMESWEYWANDHPFKESWVAKGWWGPGAYWKTRRRG